jgi:hypothetical protein
MALSLSLCSSQGVVIEGLCGGEWFMLPTTPAAMSVADYSPQMQAEFCAADAAAPEDNLNTNETAVAEVSNNDDDDDDDDDVISGRNGSSCRLPTAEQRDTPSLGNALLQWKMAEDPSVRSFRYNRFISQQVAG